MTDTEEPPSRKRPPSALCACCDGHGHRWLPRRRIDWPCPACEGEPHPSTGPAEIRTHAR